MNERAPPGQILSLPLASMARLMPLYCLVSQGGYITEIGPTLARMVNPCRLLGRPFLEVFQVRRPASVTDFAALAEQDSQRLEVVVRDGPATLLRGLNVPMADGGRLINLSFGIGVIEAVRRHGLTDADFAPTDLTVEMLYVVEAKTAVMDELRELNLRLRGAKERAEEEAMSDTLTGLRNRRALEAALADLMARSQPFGLMHLDLDYFKEVNDTHGHAAGDHVLQQVAQVLIEETRIDDTVARIGGDEFVIVMPQLADAEQMAQIAGRINARLDQPILFNGQECQVSISIGMVLSRDCPTADPARLLAAADHALYDSKHAGRGTARMFSASRSPQF
jgi:diguanylate cyclase (GGDEF)-like protein